MHGCLAQVVLFTLEPIRIFSIFVELSLLVYQRPKVWARKCNGRRQTTKNERPRFPIESFSGLARFRTTRPYAHYLPPYCQHLLAQSFNCQPVPLARLATRTSPAHPSGPFLPSHARTPPAHQPGTPPAPSARPCPPIRQDPTRPPDPPARQPATCPPGTPPAHALARQTRLPRPP